MATHVLKEVEVPLLYGGAADDVFASVDPRTGEIVLYPLDMQPKLRELLKDGNPRFVGRRFQDFPEEGCVAVVEVDDVVRYSVGDTGTPYVNTHRRPVQKTRRPGSNLYGQRDVFWDRPADGKLRRVVFFNVDEDQWQIVVKENQC